MAARLAKKEGFPRVLYCIVLITATNSAAIQRPSLLFPQGFSWTPPHANAVCKGIFANLLIWTEGSHLEDCPRNSKQRQITRSAPSSLGSGNRRERKERRARGECVDLRRLATTLEHSPRSFKLEGICSSHRVYLCVTSCVPRHVPAAAVHDSSGTKTPLVHQQRRVCGC